MGMTTDIAEYLQLKKVGTIAKDIFEAYMPDDDKGKLNNVIAVFQYGGAAPDTVIAVERPNLQIRVRDIDIDAAEAKAQDIQAILHGLNNFSLNGTRYIKIQALQSPTPIGVDAKKRFEYVCNFEVIKEIN